MHLQPNLDAMRALLFVTLYFTALVASTTSAPPTNTTTTSTTNTSTTTPTPYTTRSTTTPTTTTSTTPSPFTGNIWALLVAGSNGFFNYRHQADVCHAYQILKKNGIPEENIIVMMYDDIANSEDNPRKGIVINKPGGHDVYKGVKKDYVGEEVNVTNFLNILKGDKEALRGIGSERVIESGPNDHIFVNFVDHGSPGALIFPSDELLADDLVAVLKEMAANNQFRKMVLYIEACYSGSMFDSILPDNLNIFVTTAADPHESSYACYYDETIGTYLGDLFSVNWMEDTEVEDLVKESLNHQFEVVRTKTKQSHVEEYGDLDIGSTRLASIIGKDVSDSKLRILSEKWKHKSRDIDDVVVSYNVSVAVLQKKLEKTVGKYQRQELKLELHHIFKKRKMLDELFTRLIDTVSDGDNARVDHLQSTKGNLDKDNFECYKILFNHFSQKCFRICKNPYVSTHMQTFVNFCDSNWSRVQTMINAIDSECSGWQNQFVGVHSII